MKILFFGTASAVPAAGNGFTSFIVSLGDAFVLVDTGDNPVRALREAGLDPALLDAVVLTHAHVDHLGAYPALVSTLDCMARRKELVVIAAGPTAAAARRVLHAFDIREEGLSFPIRYAENFGDGGAGGAGVSGGRPGNGKPAAGFSVSLLPGNHTIPTSMVLFEEDGLRLLYSADIRHDGGVRLFPGGCDALVHEATYPHEALPDPTGHSSALQAGAAAAKAGAGIRFLCHILGDSYPAGLRPRDEAGRAFDGRIVEPDLLTWYTIDHAERYH